MPTVVCSVLDRVGFLWGHKIPLPIKGALFRVVTYATAHGVGGADEQKGGRRLYEWPCASGATFFVRFVVRRFSAPAPERARLRAVGRCRKWRSLANTPRLRSPIPIHYPACESCEIYEQMIHSIISEKHYVKQSIAYRLRFQSI